MAAGALSAPDPVSPPWSLQHQLTALGAALPAGTRLLAVSKGHPAATVRQLAALGQRSFAESRLQEAIAKQAELADLAALDWHFIGRLQANKVRAVLRQFGTIHSVDSLELAERLVHLHEIVKVQRAFKYIYRLLYFAGHVLSKFCYSDQAGTLCSLRTIGS